MRVSANWPPGLLLTGVSALLWLAAGCEQHSSGREYRILRGAITSMNNETGELVIETNVADRPATEDAAAAADRNPRLARTTRYFCDVTKISEIYINDQLRRMAELVVGDHVEIVVSREGDTPMERFTVAFVYVNRDLPRASPPQLPQVSLRPVAPSLPSTTP